MNNMINAGQQAPAAPVVQNIEEDTLRLCDALDILESQQGAIYRIAIELNHRLSGQDYVEEVSKEVYSYEERLKRLLRYTDEILCNMNRLIERF